MGLDLSLTTLLMPSPYKKTTYRMSTVNINVTNTQLNLSRNSNKYSDIFRKSFFKRDI